MKIDLEKKIVRRMFHNENVSNKIIEKNIYIFVGLGCGGLDIGEY